MCTNVCARTYENIKMTGKNTLFHVEVEQENRQGGIFSRFIHPLQTTG